MVLPESTDMVSLHSQMAMIFSDLSDVQREYGAEHGIRLFYADKGLVMQMADTVLFDLGRADIRPGAAPLIDRIAEAVKDAPHGVRIEGHTDDLPIATGRYPSNWELSTARAVNVLRYFVEQKGIPSDRLFAVGYSRYRPLFPNDSSENRARNRRVEIVFEAGAADRKGAAG
jgi:chemotaxis protein MotB